MSIVLDDDILHSLLWVFFFLRLAYRSRLHKMQILKCHLKGNMFVILLSLDKQIRKTKNTVYIYRDSSRLGRFFCTSMSHKNTVPCSLVTDKHSVRWIYSIKSIKWLFWIYYAQQQTHKIRQMNTTVRNHTSCIANCINSVPWMNNF